MWSIAEYSLTGLFSLRPANATTSGGKTLLIPTPYTIKMALLDAAIRVYGKTQAVDWFPQIRDLSVSIRLPARITVINTFIKILRPHKGGAKDTTGTGLVGPMGSTIAYREFVQFVEPIAIALEDLTRKREPLPSQMLLPQIHYFGKRGGFVQITGLAKQDELSENFTHLTKDTETSFALMGTMQLLDDCGPKMTFEHVDVYSNKPVAINKPNGRLLRPIILPYRVTRSSRGYTLYQRLDVTGEL